MEVDGDETTGTYKPANTTRVETRRRQVGVYTYRVLYVNPLWRLQVSALVAVPRHRKYLSFCDHVSLFLCPRATPPCTLNALRLL